ncbi:hypothetical protein PMAYCL1PPCAC_25551, partial [Pristionchus mayeri]
RMASDFVLLWEINNATAAQAAGKTESEVFDEGGFKWTARAVQNAFGNTDFSLRCGVDHNGPWKCEGNVQLRYGEHSCNARPFNFHDNNSIWKLDNYDFWTFLTDDMYCFNDKTALEFHIYIISSEGTTWISDPGIFAGPNNMSNVILKIGDGRLHVSKEVLAIHSPVFKTLFFGHVAKKDKAKVRIN